VSFGCRKDYVLCLEICTPGIAFADNEVPAKNPKLVHRNLSLIDAHAAICRDRGSRNRRCAGTSPPGH